MMKLSHLNRGSVEPTDGERGVVLPLAAFSMVAILLVATVVIDASHAYPQRRSMQNAADTASLAATRALDRVKYLGADWTTVAAEAADVAADNGAESWSCTVIKADGTDLGSCDEEVKVTDHDGAAGISVVASDVRETTFGAVAGVDSVTASAQAASTIQSFLGGTGAPFIICGNPALQGFPILNDDGTIDEEAALALGEFPLQGPQVPDCGASSSAFKGKAEPGDPMLVGEWAQITPGNGFSNDTRIQVLGAKPCVVVGNELESDCDMLLPIADEAGPLPGNKIEMKIAGWAVIHVTPQQGGNPRYTGRFMGTRPYVTGGETGVGLPTDGTAPRVVRLIR